jgi:hypothetical protein
MKDYSCLNQVKKGMWCTRKGLEWKENEEKCSVINANKPLKEKAAQ